MNPIIKRRAGGNASMGKAPAPKITKPEFAPKSNSDQKPAEKPKSLAEIKD